MSRSGLINKRKGRLFYVLGRPMSGKSQWCNNWIKQENYRVIIGGDDFRHALYGKEFQSEAEGTVFAMMDIAARALLNRGFDVVIDETSSTVETLRRYYRIDINAIPIWINTNKEECIERATKKNMLYLIPHIKRIDKQLKNLWQNFNSKILDIRLSIMERSNQDVSI